MISWPEGSVEFVSTAPAEEGIKEKRWLGKVKVGSSSMYMAELIINYGRESCINAVVGKYKGGQYICIPEMDIGCPVGSLSDIKGNKERLSAHMCYEDAATVAHALRALSGYSGMDWF